MAIVNLMLVLCVRVPGTQCPFKAFGGVICLTAVGYIGQEVGVKAVRNVVGILSVVGSCMCTTMRSAEERNPKV